jgi:exonuclease SbcD
MRILHTGDWHLGRQMRGLSRQGEFEAVLDEMVGIVRDEAVDVFIVAGDVFDTFSPPTDAEKLLYETLTRLLRERVQVVIVAGNHDHAARMDALSGILEVAGIHCVGSVPDDETQALKLPSRDGAETLSVVALPWVPERFAFEYESLAGPVNEPVQQYAGKLEQAMRHFWHSAERDPMAVFVGHMLIDGAEVAEGGGERRLHIGQNFAVKAQALPQAQYVALGHIHRYQQLSAAAPAYYAGSPLQLDFGEAGQEKAVNVVELKARQPALVRKMALSAGRKLRSLSLRMDELPGAMDRYGDDFLRVTVDLDRPALNLYQHVREFLPNAVEVTPRLPVQEVMLSLDDEERRGLAPDQLLERYYRQKHGVDIGPELRTAFNELYAEALTDAAD